MSIAEPKALYREPSGRISTPDDIDRAVRELAANRDRFRRTSVRERIRLVEECLRGLVAEADGWVAAACEAKGLQPGTSFAAEEMAAGPVAVARYLKLLAQSLRDIEAQGIPRVPGEIVVGPEGQVRVEVMPTRGLFDGILFSGFKAHVWMQPGVTPENLGDTMATIYRHEHPPVGISLVLGAGNVSSIPPTDAFSKLFQEGQLVLVKMNPVNEYLGPFYERAFAALLREGYLRIVYGGAEAGIAAINQPLVDEVHITGSIYSHETIVWGPPGPERDLRKSAGDPLLKKRITSELGNVTPWIVVPWDYSEKELAFQAENTAAMITNNASFNCIATKMVVTWRHWPQRERFLDLLEATLGHVPRRKAYYPGAADRFRKFTGCEGLDEHGCLPWTIVRNVAPQRDPQYFDEESFVCVCAETALDAATPADFLDAAVEFANDRLWGTLGAGLMVHPKFRREGNHEARFQRALANLRYGTIGINHWPALSYAMISPPWGGFPGGTIAEPQSGIGWVHNTYMLDKAQKTVLEGPLTVFPKPFWFPTHTGAAGMAGDVLRLTADPSLWKVLKLLPAALRG
ncbi:MAG: aldehyde dehydrogenase family protein [Pirellulales bacterium]|nr:aldehyde dehydrogenase family protein [Pirellulales bacterium]